MLKRLKETHAHPFNINLFSNYCVPGIVADPGGFSSNTKMVFPFMGFAVPKQL